MVTNIVSKLTLLSRYMFVTNEEQLTSLMELIGKKSDSLEGLLVIVDSHLVCSNRHMTKISTVINYFATQVRKFGSNILIVTNPETKLDKRIERQLTHTSKMQAKEIEPEEITL